MSHQRFSQYLETYREVSFEVYILSLNMVTKQPRYDPNRHTAYSALDTSAHKKQSETHQKLSVLSKKKHRPLSHLLVLSASCSKRLTTQP